MLAKGVEDIVPWNTDSHPVFANAYTGVYHMQCRYTARGLKSFDALQL